MKKLFIFAIVFLIVCIIFNYWVQYSGTPDKKENPPVKADTIKIDTLTETALTLKIIDPLDSINLLIDSEYFFRKAEDSVGHLQWKIVFGKDDDDFIKLEFNRLQGKHNWYKDQTCRIRDKLDTYYEMLRPGFMSTLSERELDKL